MTQPVRPAQTHRVLFWITAIIGIAAIPHAIAVYIQNSPMAILNLHLTACIIVSIHAELRRQWWKRVKAQRDLNELVSSIDGQR